MRNAGLEEAQAGIKIAGKNINNFRYADDTTLMAESDEELNSLLMKVKEERKSWLKAQQSENKGHGIWSHHFMANKWGNCCFLTCIQVSQEASQVVWYAHLFQNFPQFIVIHTVKGFGIVNKAK